MKQVIYSIEIMIEYNKILQFIEAAWLEWEHEKKRFVGFAFSVMNTYHTLTEQASRRSRSADSD